MKILCLRSLCIRVIWMMTLMGTATLNAQWRLKTLSWNVESGDSELQWVADQMALMEGYDVLALSEVNPDWAPNLVEAAEDGEGAKGNWEADFDYVLSETGSGQRLMIIWDNLRFERIGDAVELDNLNTQNLNYRSPLYVQLRHRTNETSFIVMVNHLARGAEDIRNMQATGLVSWAVEQTLPVIALGDYNFDYDIDEGVGNAGFNLFTQDEHWIWVRPERLKKSQSAFSYNSILDFAFAANIPENWAGYSEILSLYEPFEDDDVTVDHRPLDTTFFIFPVSEEENPDLVTE